MKIIHHFAAHLSIAIQICSLALGLLCNLVLARLLGSDGYGVYSIVYTVVSLVGMPLEVGLAMVMVREISILTAEKDWARIRGAIRASMFISLTFSFLWIAGCTIAVLITNNDASRYASALPWAAFLLPIAGMAAVRGSVLRGLGHPLWGQTTGTIIRPALFLLILAITALSPWADNSKFDLSPNEALAMQTLASALALGFGIWLMDRLVQKEVSPARPIYKWKQWLTEIPGYCLMATAFAANNALASVVIAFFKPPDAVGVYRVAELGASLVAMPLGAIAIHYSADISRLITQGDTLALREHLRQGARVALCVACPIAVAFLLLGSHIIEFTFGGSFRDAFLPLSILVVAQIVNTITGLAGIVMSMGGHHREAFTAVCIAMAVQFMTSILLVPYYSIVGAAISSALATLIWCQILRRRVQRIYRVSTLAV